MNETAGQIDAMPVRTAPRLLRSLLGLGARPPATRAEPEGPTAPRRPARMIVWGGSAAAVLATAAASIAVGWTLHKPPPARRHVARPQAQHRTREAQTASALSDLGIDQVVLGAPAAAAGSRERDASIAIRSQAGAPDRIVSEMPQARRRIYGFARRPEQIDAMRTLIASPQQTDTLILVDVASLLQKVDAALALLGIEQMVHVSMERARLRVFGEMDPGFEPLLLRGVEAAHAILQAEDLDQAVTLSSDVTWRGEPFIRAVYQNDGGFVFTPEGLRRPGDMLVGRFRLAAIGPDRLSLTVEPMPGGKAFAFAYPIGAAAPAPMPDTSPRHKDDSQYERVAAHR